MKTFIPVNVYSSGNDSSNSGVTFTRPTRLVVEHPEGHITEDALIDNGYLVLQMDTTNAVRACFRPEGRGRGMFGGNFVWSCDSRFRALYGQNPIPVHDRFEG